MSQRIFYRILLAFAIAFSGSAAQLHSLAHAQADLSAAGEGHKSPSTLKHSTDQCLVVHALDGTAAERGGFTAGEGAIQQPLLLEAMRGGELPAAAYRPRAPPLS